MVINESLAHIYAGTTAAPALRQPLIHSHSRRHRHATLLAAVLMWDHRLLVNRCSAEWKGERPEIICLTWSSSQLSRWEEGRKRACVRVFFLCAVVLSVCVWRQVRVSLHLPSCRPSICWFGSRWHVESKISSTPSTRPPATSCLTRPLFPDPPPHKPNS